MNWLFRMVYLLAIGADRRKELLNSDRRAKAMGKTDVSKLRATQMALLERAKGLSA